MNEVKIKEDRELGLVNFIEQFKSSYIGREVIPLECSFGWPIPVEYDGQLCIKIFYYRASKQERKKIAINAPLVEFIIDYKTKKVLAFNLIKINSHYSGVQQEGIIGHFPHEAIMKMNVGTYKLLQLEAFQLLEEVFESKLNERPMAKEKILRLSELMNLLISPCLLPYYKVLNEKFITSLEKMN